MKNKGKMKEYEMTMAALGQKREAVVGREKIWCVVHMIDGGIEVAVDHVILPEGVVFAEEAKKWWAYEHNRNVGEEHISLFGWLVRCGGREPGKGELETYWEF